ncbi:unnamed protein product [Arabidopsis thaliana]|uniref:(thale cress) hypothetical protein n=1 Tax=Arabidopsis thaliana TaxID=3702 RepID=A0A178V9C5_ARATH|nr:hypothetical protein AXX17_AT3G42140 [Arabidopsis thaliana]CAD5325180.1 unnamed protein product [Arabidopsis thaliana]
MDRISESLLSVDLVWLEALTNWLRNEDDDAIADPLSGTALAPVEKPRPCLKRAAPSPLRVSSS